MNAANRPLCGACFAEWERVLTPGQQPPEPFRLMHIGTVTGADLNRQALQRADDYWARVRAYQDHIAERCRTVHTAPVQALAVVDVPLPELKEVA